MWRLACRSCDQRRDICFSNGVSVAISTAGSTVGALSTRRTGPKQEPCLLAIDAFALYLTLAVYYALKAQKTTLFVILRGCTKIVQVLDVFINKLLKDLIKEEQDSYYN